MLICFICKLHHRSSSLLCQHLRFYHGLYPGKTLRLKCGQPGCSSLICTYSGFKKHLIRLHRDTVSTNTVNNMDTQIIDEPSTSNAVCTDIPVTNKVSVDKHHLVNMCGSVVAQLQSSGVAESTINASKHQSNGRVNGRTCK